MTSAACTFSARRAAESGGASSIASLGRKALSLGTYPEVSLAKAREDREEARRQLAAGVDPSAARQQVKRQKVQATASNFESVAREWLENVKPGWAAIYYGDTVKRFEAFVFPAIGRRPIAGVTPSELLPLMRKIEARGTLVTAHKVLRACRQVFAYAIASGRCERNPAADLRGALRSLPRPKHSARCRRVTFRRFFVRSRTTTARSKRAGASPARFDLRTHHELGPGPLGRKSI